MSLMFTGGALPDSVMAFDSDLSGRDVSKVTDMSFMFLKCKSFNSDLSGWDVSKVTNMKDMFTDATSFDRNLGSWDVSNVTDMSFMFRRSNLSTTNYDAILEGWSTLELQKNVSFDAGNVNYSASSQVARDILTNTYNWKITDIGVAP